MKRWHKPALRRVGLARALSKMGFCSRSHAAELIRAGRVRVNGSIKRDPEAPVHEGKDRISVDEHEAIKSRFIYWMLNKPRGLITTTADERGRLTIYELLPKDLPWLAPVGRLDKASEGLLLLSNDSEWAARITAPETHLDKTYHVQINSIASESLAAALEAGVRDNGEMLRAKHCSVLRTGERHSWLEIVLDEGKNRQIRRMLQALDLSVLRLVRVKIGTLELGTLGKNSSRPLTTLEKASLDRAMSGK